MIICDSNVIIELLKGNGEVLDNLDRIGSENILISSITAMEIYYGALNNKELKKLRKYLAEINTIHLNKDISEIATNLIIEYANSHNLEIPDALIAASALSEEMELYTYNLKDFNYIKNLKLYKTN